MAVLLVTLKTKSMGNTWLSVIFSIILVVCGYLYDRYTPLGVAGGLIYVVFVMSGMWFREAAIVFIFAAVGSAFTVIGYFTIDEIAASDLWVVQLNRFMSVAVLWVVACLCYVMKRTLTKSETSERLLSTIIDNTAEGIITFDHSGNIATLNKASESIFGYKSDEVIGENIKTLMAEPFRSEHDGYLKNYQTTGERKIIGIGREVEGRRKDGHVFPIDLSVSEVVIQNRKIYTGIIRDITEAKRAHDELFAEKERLRKLLEENESLSNEIRNREKAEEAIRQANAELKGRTKELAQANAELSQFTYAVSHDLKSPLRAIYGYSNWLAVDLADTLEGDHKDYIEGMQEAVGQAERLIDDLLELSRIGRREAPLESIKLGEFFDQLIKGLNIEDDSQVVLSDQLPAITTSPTILNQIFQNLIVNGLTYNQSPTKRVEIRCQSIDSGFEISVADNGIGIDPEFHRRVFQIFRRLHTREEFEGTGVGLAIVKKAVHQIGGEIRIQSQLGEGSIFFVTIPHGGQRP